MPDQDTVTNLVDEFFAEGNDPEPAAGGLADDFLNDVLNDEGDPPAPEAPGKQDDADPPEPEPEKDDDGSDDEGGEEEADDPKAEGEEEDDVPEDPPKGSSKKASEDWKKLRASRDRYKEEAAKVAEAKDGEIAALQAKVQELEELRGKAALSAELEEKLANYEEMEKIVSLYRVEESAEYKKAVAEPLAAIEAQVEAIGKENEASVDALFDALAEPDLAKQRQKLKEVTAGWDEIDKVEIRNMAADARTLLNKQREMRENAKAAAAERETLSKQEAEKAAAEAKKAFADASKDAIERIKDKVPFVPLRDGETVEDRFAAVAEKLKSVDFDSNNVRDKAFAAASALVLPTAVKTIGKLQEEVKALEKRLAEKNSTKPGKAAPVDDAGEDDEDFFDALGIGQLDASKRLNVTL